MRDQYMFLINFNFIYMFYCLFLLLLISSQVIVFVNSMKILLCDNDRFLSHVFMNVVSLFFLLLMCVQLYCYRFNLFSLFLS